jgi:hypothetical protein
MHDGTAINLVRDASRRISRSCPRDGFDFNSFNGRLGAFSAAHSFPRGSQSAKAHTTTTIRMPIAT